MIFAYLLFCLPALLVIVPAFTNFVWKLTILVTEYSHYYILLLLISLSFFLNHPLFFVPLIASLAAITLLLSVHIRAIYLTTNLEFKLQQSFHYNTIMSQSAYSVFNLFKWRFINKLSPIHKVYDIDKQLILHFYQKNDRKKQPCIVVVHGGAWDSGDNTQLPELNYILANSGISVAAVNYRLAPTNKFPAPVDDVINAVEYLKLEAETLNVDTNNIFLLGRSAGGQIALCASCQLGHKEIKGVIAYYTPADLVWGYSFPGNPWILDSRKVLENYLGGTYNEVTNSYEKATALNLVNEETPPILMIHGNRDEMVAYEHNIRLIEYLRKFNIKHHLISFPWATHGGDYNINGPMGQISSFATLSFVKGLSSIEANG